ncbi:MAG: Swarming motility regulation sensor protein RssA [Burkholderia lata]|uniref:histidine kinase n=1 Tax=Burkholderia lata (strain ATCC 17760 / DSM 23089 / LMG 22485 / NCIMB 9086 / R18194 / 383) TaxID=482957 RepID=A0A833UPV4_BURL3|nr:HAMP domain-containing sensor histidine kinase [Burkholderia lata]KAF1039056.1 MAG: Swarming motility regulation sensor protein RssA [Burkholderia lata]
MDGFKKRLNESIGFRLSVALSAAILVVATAAAAFAFSSAFDEAHELQDDVLREVATLLDREHTPSVHADGTGPARESDELSRVIVQPLGGTPQPGSDGTPPLALALAPTLADGLHTVDTGGSTYRVMVRTFANGERIAVAQEAGMRDDVARESAWRTALPLLILVPILLLLVADLVRKLFRPVAVLSAGIDARDEHDLRPVPAEHVPVEVRPFVVAINRMLERVAQSVAAQRRFVADAAHELRSPLTAMSLQAERLAEADLPDDARARLAALRGGLDRSRHLIGQLLALARAQSAPAAPPGNVSVHAVYRRVLEDLMPLADAKAIDIGIEDGPDTSVSVDELELVSLVMNLVDNAIRYTLPGGRVDLSTQRTDTHACVTIADTGPGIAPHERARVFDPFYRVPGNAQIGSGLGLSIVKIVADRMGAGITLAYADEAESRGLRISVRIPLVQTPGATQPDNPADTPAQHAPRDGGHA